MSRLAVLALLICTPAALSQSFEVASIRARQLPLPRIAGFNASGPRVAYEAWPILMLVMEAYDLKRHQVAFLAPPPDADTAYYDIVAKAEGDAPHTRAEFRPLLQKLLADRFHLQFHREGRELPVYALIVGKSGPRFKPSAPGAVYHFLGGVNGRNQTITATAITMDDLAISLANYGLDRPAVDRTGLAGAYDVKLEATPDFRRNADPDAVVLSIFTAVQEQLGLKLEPQKATVQVLIVDHVERPSSN